MGKSRQSRQSEARRQLGEVRPTWQRRLRDILNWPLAVAVAFFLAVTLIAFTTDDRFPYANGMELHQPVFARVAFARLNENRTSEKKRTVQEAVPNYYRFNQVLLDRLKAEFVDLHTSVKAAEDFTAFVQASGSRWPVDKEEGAFRALKAMTDETGSRRFKEEVDGFDRSLRRESMVARPDPERRQIRSTVAQVLLNREGDEFSPVGKERLTFATNLEHVQALAGRLVTSNFPKEARPLLKKLVVRTIAQGEPESVQPPFLFDDEYTLALMDEEAEKVLEFDPFKPGDQLVSAGLVDSEKLELLKDEHKEYLKQREDFPELRREWQYRRLGLAGAIFLITTGLAIYVRWTQPRIVNHPARAVAFASLLLIMLLCDQLLVLAESPLWCVSTVAVTSAVLTFAYNQRFAAGATALFCLLTAMVLGEPTGLFLVLLTVACVTIMHLNDIRTRIRLVQVGFVAALAAFTSATLVGLLDQQEAQFLFWNAFYAAIATLLGVGSIFFLLPVIEWVFGIATSLTLLEWADTSAPLLRQLIQKAPGTWQHSHLLGTMAESAAEEIGVNGLLVRVGAYYHDIGKMCKPNYFVENQQANINAHDGLAPTMSLLVILAHVKDGLALAKEYSLPPVLHQFIAEHHGTTVVRYFHAMAAQGAKPTGRHDREVSEAEFRYPGPKPRSRESAILMLCDSVEGAVRALQEPTPGRIESVVHDLVMGRLMDGQLDDCEFSLKELSRVEQSLVRSLCAIHHGRIAYPKSA